MASPRFMFTYTLDAAKGWPSPHCVDFHARISPNVTINPVQAGSVAHLNAAGEYEMGLPDIPQTGHMAIFLWQSSDEPDVSNFGGPVATEPHVWVEAGPSGNVMGLVAAGAYELNSTRFEPEATAGPYVPGECLTGFPDNDDATRGGRLERAIPYQTPICGVVSRGARTNAHRRRVLHFWPVWLPSLPQAVIGT